MYAELSKLCRFPSKKSVKNAVFPRSFKPFLPFFQVFHQLKLPFCFTYKTLF